MSFFQSTFQCGEQVKVTELDPVNKGGVRALECTYLLKTASPQGHCELAHCLDVESMISSFTIPSFSSSLVLGAWSEPQSSTFD
jgi:hypothetical protein